MLFSGPKPNTPAPADVRAKPPASPPAPPSVDLLSIASTATGALMRANDAETVLQALLKAATECGAARPRAGLWREEEASYAMWQLDGSGAMVSCGTAPASLYAGALALEDDPAMVGALIPIASPGRRWGVLDVSGQLNDGSALAALAIVARQAALALERKAGGGEAEPTGAMLEVVERWWDSYDTDTLFRQVVQDVAELTGADSCCVTVLGPNTGETRLLFSEDVAGLPPASMAGMSDRPYPEKGTEAGLPWQTSPGDRRNKDGINHVLRTGEPLAFRWNPTSEALKAGILPSGPDEGSYLAQAIERGDNALGVLDILSRTRRAFGPAEESVLAASARMLARLLSRKQEDIIAAEVRRRQNILAAMGMRLSGQTDPAQASAVITSAARELWPTADLIYVMLPQGEGGLWSIASLDSMRAEDQRHGWARSGEGFAGWVIQTRQPLAISSGADDPRRGALDRGQNVQAGAWAPMVRGDLLVGIVAVALTQPGQCLAPSDLDQLERIAELGAAAFESVRDRQTTQAAFWDAIEAISGAIDARDGYTHGHSRNVTEYAVAMAQRMELAPHEVQSLRAASLLHDIGKIGTPDHILNKPGKLTPDERTVMASHPEVGYEILQRAPSLQALLPAVRFHHERPDGKGYPLGLSGDALPRQARIVAVADAFDAMTSDRVYRKRMSVEKATSILVEGRGTQWDETCVDTFLEIVNEHGTPRLQMLMAEDSGRQYLPSLGMDVFGT